MFLINLLILLFSTKSSFAPSTYCGENHLFNTCLIEQILQVYSPELMDFN